MTTTDPVLLHERILAEATRLFVTSGYNGISMREIAAAVGVSKAGLYYHFKDKQDLFLAILNANLNTIERLVQAARHAPTVREQIGHMVRGLFAEAPEQRAIIRLANQEMAHIDPEARAAFGQIYHQKFIGQIEAILREGIARGELRPMDTRLAVWIMLGMIYPFFGAAPDREQAGHEPAIELMLTVFFDGAAPFREK